MAQEAVEGQADDGGNDIIDWTSKTSGVRDSKGLERLEKMHGVSFRSVAVVSDLQQ